MSHQRPRPRGISVLASLELVGGIVICVTAGWFIAQFSLAPSYHNTSGLASSAAFFFLFVFVYGILVARAGYGMWKGKRWGWTWSAILTIAGMLTLVVVSLGFLRPGPPYYVQFIIPAVAIVAGLVVLSYLWKSTVRAYCEIG